MRSASLICAILIACAASDAPRASAQARDDNENLVMGNPSNAKADAETSPDNFLVARKQFVLSYNNSQKIPNWVSWHLNKEWIGTTGRRGVFRPDDQLPDSWYHVTPADYSETGFDRGHMGPSGDRTKTFEDNNALFVMSNIVPQAPDNNRNTWERLESSCRDLAAQGHELYIIGGPAGAGGTGSKGFRTTLNAHRRIRVPSVTWKVILVLPEGANDVSRVDKNTRTIAVIVPNHQGLDPDWKQYRHSVREVEELTGYNFFSNVSQDVQDAIEVGVDGSAEDEGNQ
jgi:endonuclease G, mitochondrial